MNAEVKKLYDQKGKAWAQMQEVGERLKKGEALTKEESEKFDAWDAEIKSADEAIKKLERVEELEKSSAAFKLKKEEVEPEQVKTFNLKPAEARTIFMKAEVGQKMSKLENEKFEFLAAQDTVFRKFMNNENITEQEAAILKTLRTNTTDYEGNQRAQTVTTTGGGYTIPQGFLNDLIVYLKFVSPFFEEMKVGATATAKSLFYYLNTPTGAPLPCPSLDDTSNTGELVAINTDIFTNTTDMVFGTISMGAYKYGPKPMKVPSELLQDSGIDIPGTVAETQGTRMGRILNTHFTTGDNSGKPQGITNASVGEISAGNDAVTFDDIIDLVHSVDPAYRKSPSARFMLNDGILKYIKKLSIGSSDARPLWMPSFRDGAPDTIDGYQYLINQDMQSSVADGTKVMLFGDMKAFAIRQAGPFVLKFLDQRFADIDQVAWLLLARFDARLRNTSAIKALEVS
jgi:HK97 family phage major capsid protein